MRIDKLFSKLKKKIGKKIQVASHRLLIKGDFISPLAAGIYLFLPLGFKIHRKIEEIIRQEMENLNAQEVFLSSLIPKSLWEETGRWKTIDPPLFKVKDRHKKEFGLGSTHEEVIVHLAKERILSYKDLPLAVFQIQTKFRNELRSFGGLLRTREFVMKDLYSFHKNEKELDDFYKKTRKAYFKIFKKCGLKTIAVEALSGTIGGKFSEEFMAPSPFGEDKIAICGNCSFKANVEKLKKEKNCPFCRRKLNLIKAIEVGHIFKLETIYAKKMNAFFKDKNGLLKPIFMGCYGIGIGRLISAIVEQNHDERGIIWPSSVAPFKVHLIALFSGEKKTDKKIKKIIERVYRQLKRRKIEVLLDDREEISGGEKLVVADLVGIPWRIIISRRTLKKNSAELKRRKSKRGKLISLKEIFKKNYD